VFLLETDISLFSYFPNCLEFLFQHPFDRRLTADATETLLLISVSLASVLVYDPL